jgi:putative membrane protein
VIAAAFPAWHVHPTVWLVVAGLWTGYHVGLRRAGAEGGQRATPAQRRLWAAGVLTLWVAADWPIHDLAERYLYSVHMVQHLLLSLVAPPLLLLGTPDWFARWLLRPRWLFTTVRQLSRPFFALMLFNTYLVFTHWPTMVTISLHSEWAHFALHTGLLLTALLMWMPVLSPLPEIKRLPPPAQMFYLFLQSVVPTVPASFLTLTDNVIYRAYIHLPKLWGLSTIEDQRIAGLLMKLLGGAILWGFIAASFFRWAYREQAADRLARQRGLTRMPSDGSVLTWDEVEAELNRLPSTPSET